MAAMLKIQPTTIIWQFGMLITEREMELAETERHLDGGLTMVSRRPRRAVRSIPMSTYQTALFLPPGIIRMVT